MLLSCCRLRFAICADRARLLPCLPYGRSALVVVPSTEDGREDCRKRCAVCEIGACACSRDALRAGSDASGLLIVGNIEGAAQLALSDSRNFTDATAGQHDSVETTAGRIE
jgi:hypothetical protein